MTLERVLAFFLITKSTGVLILSKFIPCEFLCASLVLKSLISVVKLMGCILFALGKSSSPTPTIFESFLPTKASFIRI